MLCKFLILKKKLIKLKLPARGKNRSNRPANMVCSSNALYQLSYEIKQFLGEHAIFRGSLETIGDN
jgi:hypothetical protein